MSDVRWGTPLSHPAATTVHTELLDGWGEHPRDMFWWLLTASHPVAGMHPQPSWARAPGGCQTPTCPGSRRILFLSLRPCTPHCSRLMDAALQQGNLLPASGAAQHSYFGSIPFPERAPTDPRVPALRG